MKTTTKTLAIALALSARLVSVQAHAAEFYGSSTDPHAAVNQSGLYNPSDRYAAPDGFPLSGWAQLKYSNE
jgi:hypothetical protein